MAAKTPENALVLSGGGSRGAYQAGAWKALAETGFEPELIVGVSAGALNGAMIAVGTPPEEMERWWVNLRQKDVLRVRRDLWRWSGRSSVYSAVPLRALLEAHLDLEALRRSRVDFALTAVDLEGGCEMLFGKDEVTVEHLVASTALVPGLQPVAIGGRHYVDGGHWSALPLRHAVEAGATCIHALLHDPVESHEEPMPVRFRSLWRRVSDVVWHGHQQLQLQFLEARTRLPRRDPLRVAPFELHMHAPDPPLQNEILRFQPALARKLFTRGYEETRVRLAG